MALGAPPGNGPAAASARPPPCISDRPELRSCASRKKRGGTTPSNPGVRITPLDDSKTSIPASMHARRSTHTRTWHDERMPEMTPLAATDAEAVKWAAEETKPIDTTAEEKEDEQDEAAMTAWKQEMKDKHKVSEDKVAQIVDMQHMDAK